ncbi:MAG: chalcone isomerase family protein [Rhodospirillales bacterium]|nr:chalcone isomerase family protein [Rhodospirillales bacterium]MDE1883621.1 chalcone isomerase family protein [Rhodospirillales bacterium]
MTRLNKNFLAASLLALSAMAPLRAQAAQLGGVTMPDAQTLGTQTLTLNGIGLRTYSILHVHIYVAGLYLPHPMNNAHSILQSAEPKILSLHFVRSVGLAKVRSSWKKGLTANCMAPCRLSNADLQQFLATLKPVSAGENIKFIFQNQGMNAYENGQFVGHVGNPQLARLVLAVFIGPHVNAPKLKAELLGGH